VLTDGACDSPASVSAFGPSRAGLKDMGAPLGELDEATRQKAEARYFSFYELYVDPDPDAQGTASFS